MAALNAEQARIFRITHLDNVPWILEHGIHCKSSSTQDPHFVQIGLPDLIEKRARRTVPIAPGGFLSDYVPFYFTPSSIMLYNIKTGYGVTARPNEEIVVLVSSIHRLVELAIPFVFTDAHAYMFEADYYNDAVHLGKIDWKLLQNRDFRQDPDDPGKQGRYQAEALVHQHVPVEALLGIGCYNERSRTNLEAATRQYNRAVPIRTVTRWYF
jgi:hypothetical protein